jgi:hypothetical protein
VTATPPPVATPTAPAAGRHPPAPAKHRPSPHIPLALHVAPLHVHGGDMLTIRAHTAPRGSLTLTLKVTRQVTTWTSKGHHRRRHTHTHVLYQITARSHAGRRGDGTVRLHVRYHPARPIAATLSVTARVAHAATTRTARLTILPPRPPSHKHSAPRRHKQ